MATWDISGGKTEKRLNLFANSVTALADHYIIRLCSKRIQVTEAGNSAAQVVLYGCDGSREAQLQGCHYK